MKAAQGKDRFITSYSEFVCIIPKYITPGPDDGPQGMRIWSLSFKPDRELASLFPYINGDLDDALYYEKPEHISFLFEGYRCFIYSELASAHYFETQDAARAFTDRLIAFFNRIHARKADIKPNYDQITHVPITDILRILPQTNCRACGYMTCMAFAAGIIKGKVRADACPGLVRPMRENAVYPVFDHEGNVVDSVSLRISTSELKHRIREQEGRIHRLEACLQTGEQNPPEPDDPGEQGKDDFGLSQREIEVLKLIAEGHTNNEISGVLFISPHTVKSHMINIFNKMGVNDRTQAAVLGTRHHLI